MAGVVFDAKFSPAYASSDLDPNDTAYITVGSGSNRALLVGLIFEDGTFDYSTFINVIWDANGSNQAMTKIGSVVNTTVARNVILYGLLNPTPGTKTLRIANHGGMVHTVSAISFSSVNQASLAAAFAHFTSALSTTDTTNPSVTITSATGNMVAGLIGQNINGGPGIAVNETEWFHRDYRGGGNYAAGAASKTLSATLNSPGKWIAVGIDVVAAPVISLVANNLAVAAPTIGQPALGQKHVLPNPNGITISHADVTASVLVQTHVLGANALTTALPTFSAPSMAPVIPLVANTLATAAPTFGQGLLGQGYAFSANTLATGAPTVLSAVLTQKQVLSANVLAVQAPTSGVPVLGQSYVFPIAQPLTVGTPTLGTRALGQIHKLVGSGLSLVAPNIGTGFAAVPTLVTFDAKFSTIYGPTNSDPVNIIGQLTVGTGVDRALLVAVYINNVTIDYSTFISVVWDYGVSNQLMTPIGSYGYTDGGIDIIFYGLLNPASGLKNLVVQGSGGGVSYYVEAISFTNVRQTSIADAFAHFATATGDAATQPSITVSSSPGDMVTTFFVAPGTIVSVDPTEWWHAAGGGGSYARSSGSSVTLGMAVTGLTKAWYGVGVDVALSVINVPITASNLVITTPKSIGVPVMTVPDMVIATTFTTARPSFTAPAFLENNTFTAITIADSVPTLGTPSFGQAHVFTRVDVAIGHPSFTTSGVFIARVFAAPPTLITGLPTFGAPALGQKYALNAAFSTGAPNLGVGILHQKQVLPLAINLATAAPSIPTVPFGAGRFLNATNLTAQPPTFTASPLGQTHGLTASGLTVAVPVPGPAAFSMVRVLTASELVTAAPQLGAPDVIRTDFLHAVDLNISSPSFSLPYGIGEIMPPLTWLRHRLKCWSDDPSDPYYDEDGTQGAGTPVKQAIFANYNDAIELSLSMLTLVGRTSPGWGPAEPIQVVSPLYLWDRKLLIDWSSVEQLRTDLTAEIAIREAAIVAEIAARQADIVAEAAARNAALTAEVSARGSADTAAAARLTALETRSSVDRGYTEILEPVAGFSYACHDDAGMVIIVPSGNLSSGTFVLPVNPIHLQRIDFVSTKNVATITFTPGAAGQALLNNPTSMSGGVSVAAIWRSIIGQWIFFT